MSIAPLRARSEDSRADPDVRGTESNRGFEIGCHSHRQKRQAVAFGDFPQQGEMKRRFLVHERDAHEALDRQVQFVPRRRQSR